MPRKYLYSCYCIKIRNCQRKQLKYAIQSNDFFSVAKYLSTDFLKVYKVVELVSLSKHQNKFYWNKAGWFQRVWHSHDDGQATELGLYEKAKLSVLFMEE